ncbi:helix-turn-helix domain-containing protein [Rhizobium leguminosarum]|uniref:helix-turn-helix transcriptional regulator n=1 Tax=Rhizobium leguminosarum TaxID=384 RepID=UPI001C95A17F|nr:helix-turn-helix domain-containing protein [Rhizobium leguminosarum]MBY5408634.1 helix-turn-helix domain-containing protein [Rhizobium leguminosarum]
MAEALTVTSNAESTIEADPLLIAINAYRDGLAAYDAAEENDFPLDSGEDDLYAALISGPDAVLTNWQSAATSSESALAAISLAERERAIFAESPVADAMEAAAIAYWKNAEGSQLNASSADEAQHASLADLSPDVLVRAPDAANYLKVSETTLARWRSAKRGPVYAKIGGNVAYTVSALRDYVSKSERKGTRPDK